jgi:uncharacterized membrane protein YphA (DoxX/SURF4 family)
MHASLVLALVLGCFFALLGSAKVLALQPMRQRAQHLGLAVESYRVIGVLELAGATGLVVGLVARLLGGLAAAGLLLLLAGALIAHRRRRDGLREITPAVAAAVLVAVYLALIIGAS